jgi:hypothetical protein
VDGFDLPVYVKSSKGMLLLSPESNKWNTKELKRGDTEQYDLQGIEKNYYVQVKEESGN